MKNLNKNINIPTIQSKKFQSKNLDIKKVEIQEDIQIGQYLLEKGDIIFIEDLTSPAEQKQADEEMKIERKHGNFIAKNQQMGVDSGDPQAANPNPAV